MPKPLAWGLIAVALALTIYLTVRGGGLSLILKSASESSTVLWADRYLDFMIQVALIFCGVLGVLGLLSEGKPLSKKEKPA